MRGLWPREHGAYVQLLAPLGVALLAATPTVPALLFATASCAAFLGNEPWLVLLGHRGKRARELVGVHARRRLAMLTAIAAIGGGAALVLAPAAARTIALVQIVPVACLLALAYRKAERSLAGELVASVVLPGAAAPVAIASGIPWSDAVMLWLGWSIGFGCTTIAVHHVIESQKRARRAMPPSRGAPMFGLAATTAAIAALPVGLLAALPLAIGATGVAMVSPSPRHLRVVGFSMLGAALISAALALQ